jgi:hypothetical protein
MAQSFAAMGLPALANVFYYGKEFGSQKQKLGKKGEILEEDYRPLSVTDFGEEAWQAAEQLQEVAQADKTDENDVDALIRKLSGGDASPTSLAELMTIIGRG